MRIYPTTTKVTSLQSISDTDQRNLQIVYRSISIVLATIVLPHIRIPVASRHPNPSHRMYSSVFSTLDNTLEASLLYSLATNSFFFLFFVSTLV